LGLYKDMRNTQLFLVLVILPAITLVVSGSCKQASFNNSHISKKPCPEADMKSKEVVSDVNIIMTVRGIIVAEDLGKTLVREHVMADFIF